MIIDDAQIYKLQTMDHVVTKQQQEDNGHATVSITFDGITLLLQRTWRTGSRRIEVVIIAD